MSSKTNGQVKDYHSLLERYNKFIKYRNVAAILVFAILVTVLVHVYIASFLGISQQYALLLPVAIVGLTVFFIWSSYRNHIKTDDKLFLFLQRNYESIDNFLQKKSSKNKKRVKKYLSSTINFIDNWVYVQCPSALLDLPTSMVSNLEKLQSLIKSIETDDYKIKDKIEHESKIKELNKFNTDLEEFIKKISNRNPTYDDLIELDIIFGKIRPAKGVTSIYEKIIIFFRKRSFFRFILSPIGGGISFLTFYIYDPSRFYETAQFGVIVTIMLLVPIFLWKRKND